MAACSACRTVLRRHIDILQKLRQRRAHSTNNTSTKAAKQQDQIPTPNNVPTLNFWQRLGPLTRAAQAYARAQRKRPYVTQVCTSLVIYFCSDSASILLFMTPSLRISSRCGILTGCSLGANYGREGLRSDTNCAIIDDRLHLVNPELQLVSGRSHAPQLRLARLTTGVSQVRVALREL
jgi:hypothetical protein